MRVVSTIASGDAGPGRLRKQRDRSVALAAPDDGSAPPRLPARPIRRRARIGRPLHGRCRHRDRIEPGIGGMRSRSPQGQACHRRAGGREGKGTREVQVLYSEPGGRELYFFVNNRLDRVVK